MSMTIEREHENRFSDRPETDLMGALNHVTDLVGKLARDLGSLVALQKELLKAEAKEGAMMLVRRGAMIAVGAVLGVFAFLAATFALIFFVSLALPWTLLLDIAVAGTIVAVAYGVIATVLVLVGIKALKKGGLKPERSLEEIRNDREWVGELKQ